MIKTRMKRSMKAAVLAFAMVICTFVNVVPSSAATLTAKQYMRKMEKAVAKVKSYESKTISVSNMVRENEVTQTEYKKIYFTKPVKAREISTITIKSGNLEDYQDKSYTYMRQSDDGKITSYKSYDGKKYRATKNWKSIADSLTVLKPDLYSKIKIEQENMKVNGSNTIQISGQITGDKLEKVLGDVFASFMVLDEKYTKIDYSNLPVIKVNVWINKKSYLPVKYSVDMTAFMNGYEIARQEKEQKEHCDGGKGKLYFANDRHQEEG